MKYLPKSISDYEFPSHLQSAWMAPLRWTLSATFYAGYAAGTTLRVITEKLNLPRLECRPSLVLRTDGIGDALLFEPALESLARTVSPSEVHLWAPKATCDLFAECPSITKRVVVPRGFKSGNLKAFTSLAWRARLGYAMARTSFERVVYPSESPEPLGNWIFQSVRAVDRWLNWGDLQNQREWQQNKSHDAATTVVESRPGSAHELHRNEYLADQWAQEAKLRKPRLYASPEDSQKAGLIVADWKRAAKKLGAGDLVGLVVGASTKLKQYPAVQWADAVRKIWNEHRAIVVLLGGADDREGMEHLAAHLKDVPHLRMEKPVKLVMMSAIIRRLDAMLSIDTGLAHIALSMRVPTVVLVGGSHPGRFFPWPGNSQHIALNFAMPCEGCAGRCHLESPECITKITPDDIVESYVALRVKDSGAETFRVPAAATLQLRKAAG